MCRLSCTVEERGTLGSVDMHRLIGHPTSAGAKEIERGARAVAGQADSANPSPDRFRFGKAGATVG